MIIICITNFNLHQYITCEKRNILLLIVLGNKILHNYILILLLNINNILFHFFFFFKQKYNRAKRPGRRVNFQLVTGVVQAWPPGNGRRISFIASSRVLQMFLSRAYASRTNAAGALWSIAIDKSKRRHSSFVRN